MTTKLSIEDRPRYPAVPVTELEQSAFCQTGELRAEPLEEEFKAGVQWQRLPIRYMRMSPEDLDVGIAAARARLGARLVVLGHHYQRDEIIKFADLRGDSFKLSRYAATQPEAEFIMFCGVHFMAETAAILAGSHQRVLLPNITAGCSMSDMAPADDVEDCWDDLNDTLGTGGVLPVTYMNSAAAVKALCGRNGGIVCTSSNARAVMEWSFERAERVLFLPDQHLGRNTALAMGIGLDRMVVWNPSKRLGGNTPEALRHAKVILWKGHCSVHTRFTVDQVRRAREDYPGINILVHPECTMEVVQEADHVGSTEYITRMIHESAPGSAWGVGTEVSLVNRLAREHPDRMVFSLDPIVCPCSTMYRIHPAYLLWVMDALLEGQVVNQITVAPETALQARVALERMLSVA
jgi:quinolinate synthase